ncbi:type VII secretion protein EccB [Allokutzneria sp. A3M-2-11 16]|uniref:type VII secretion protein EccB n=1 Tax=Allokutzneria sp. A3M-2-11 16 TaxID=2962043 RepID=UPI0020B75600|nr:type VII secretion protein EccB [Allokutzneria sp. A3M-2-11 16]MCP3802593.1 type VII secretion protein EccB [Allokutzneria sp. A3M-2-11 16]
MATRRDQLQAYQFMMQRVISAVMLRETDPEQTPLRRGVGAVFAGVMIAVLVAAGYGIYGIFTGIGGTSWKQPGAVIIERETGATFVYLPGPGAQASLQPTLNYTSARLLSTGFNVGPYRVSSADLAGIPRGGATVGIPGAPMSLPDAKRANTEPWTTCSVLGDNGTGGLTPTTTLMVGAGVPGGTPLGERGLLVRDESDRAVHLIWHDHRYRITGNSPDQLLRSVFGAQTMIEPVGPAWLNGLPAGQDIGPIQVDNAGQNSTVLAGRKVGDIVFHPVGNGVQNYLVRSDGLAPVNDFQVRILRGQYSVQPVEVSAAAATAAPSSNALAPAAGTAGLPAQPPALTVVGDGGKAPVCSKAVDAKSAPVVSLGGSAEALANGLVTRAQTAGGTKLADRVLLPPGAVVIVRASPSDRTDGSGALNIVTDLGIRYPVPNAEVLGKLGYTTTRAVSMPAALVQRIPVGPTLDPSLAGSVHSAG